MQQILQHIHNKSSTDSPHSCYSKFVSDSPHILYFCKKNKKIKIRIKKKIKSSNHCIQKISNHPIIQMLAKRLIKNAIKMYPIQKNAIKTWSRILLHLIQK